MLIALPELADGTATAGDRGALLSAHAADAPGQAAGLPPAARSEMGGRRHGRRRGLAGAVLGRHARRPPKDDKKHPVPAADRGLIQLYYTPASRDAAAQVRATTGALAARLLRAIEWSETQTR